jgi:predicted nicotinamide N-methyase
VPLSEIVDLILSRYNKLPPLYASRISRQPLLMADATPSAVADKRVLITGASAGLGAALDAFIAGAAGMAAR